VVFIRESRNQVFCHLREMQVTRRGCSKYVFVLLVFLTVTMMAAENQRLRWWWGHGYMQELYNWFFCSSALNTPLHTVSGTMTKMAAYSELDWSNKKWSVGHQGLCSCTTSLVHRLNHFHLDLHWMHHMLVAQDPKNCLGNRLSFKMSSETWIGKLQECNHLISVARSNLVKSEVVDAQTGMSTESKVRTSTGMSIDQSNGEHPLIQVCNSYYQSKLVKSCMLESS
jgi:hypothetical protein